MTTKITRCGLKEWEERLEEAIANDSDKLLSAELRWHSDYTKDEDGITSHSMTVIAYWNAGEEE